MANCENPKGRVAVDFGGKCEGSPSNAPDWAIQFKETVVQHIDDFLDKIKFPGLVSEAKAAAPKPETAQKGPSAAFDRPKDVWDARNLALLIVNQNSTIQSSAKNALPNGTKDPLGEIFFSSDRDQAVTGQFFYDLLKWANPAEIQSIVESVVTGVIAEVAKTKKKPAPAELKEMLQRNAPRKTI